MMDDGRSDMVTAKCDFTCVDECLHTIRVTCGQVVKISISNVADWQVVIYLRRADPNLRALAEALLACCEEDAHEREA
jgi:hypothetical protein